MVFESTIILSLSIRELASEQVAGVGFLLLAGCDVDIVGRADLNRIREAIRPHEHRHLYAAALYKWNIG